MDEAQKRHNRIKYALIAFTVVSLFLFLGIFLVFAESVKTMN
ncbi:MAG TPA: hypothetical protein V6C81_08060 [Planktothrix sp.]|jgi:hypothetical protein